MLCVIGLDNIDNKQKKRVHSVLSTYQRSCNLQCLVYKVMATLGAANLIVILAFVLLKSLIFIFLHFGTYVYENTSAFCPFIFAIKIVFVVVYPNYCQFKKYTVSLAIFPDHIAFSLKLNHFKFMSYCNKLNILVVNKSVIIYVHIYSNQISSNISMHVTERRLRRPLVC